MVIRCHKRRKACRGFDGVRRGSKTVLRQLAFQIQHHPSVLDGFRMDRKRVGLGAVARKGHHGVDGAPEEAVVDVGNQFAGAEDFVAPKLVKVALELRHLRELCGLEAQGVGDDVATPFFAAHLHRILLIQMVFDEMDGRLAVRVVADADVNRVLLHHRPANRFHAAGLHKRHDLVNDVVGPLRLAVVDAKIRVVRRLDFAGAFGIRFLCRHAHRARYL